MSDVPAVSVVIATYRAGGYLRPAIESAMRQSLSDLEILVSDDAADPAVEALARSFGDARVRYRANGVPLGPAANHWAALRETRGRHVAILNHDDLWKPEFLEHVVRAADGAPGAGLAFCDHEVIDPAGRSLPDEATRMARRFGRASLRPGLHMPFPGLVVRQTIPVAVGCVFRRSEIDLDELPDVGGAYDLWLSYVLCRRGAGAVFVPARLTAWRVHPDQLTRRGNISWTAGSLTCWQAILDDPLFAEHRPIAARRLAAASTALAIDHLRRGDARAARNAAGVARSHNPAEWKALAILGVSRLPSAIRSRML